MAAADPFQQSLNALADKATPLVAYMTQAIHSAQPELAEELLSFMAEPISDDYDGISTRIGSAIKEQAQEYIALCDDFCASRQSGLPERLLRLYCDMPFIPIRLMLDEENHLTEEN